MGKPIESINREAVLQNHIADEVVQDNKIIEERRGQRDNYICKSAYFPAEPIYEKSWDVPRSVKARAKNLGLSEEEFEFEMEFLLSEYEPSKHEPYVDRPPKYPWWYPGVLIPPAFLLDEISLHIALRRDPASKKKVVDKNNNDDDDPKGASGGGGRSSVTSTKPSSSVAQKVAVGAFVGLGLAGLGLVYTLGAPITVPATALGAAAFSLFASSKNPQEG